MTTLNWSTANTNAQASQDKELETAAGKLTLAVQSLIDNPNVSHPALVGILDQLTAALLDPNRIGQLLGAAQQATPVGALGGGTAPAGPSTPQSNPAEAQLIKDLEKGFTDLVLETGASVTSSNGQIDINKSVADAKAAIDKKVTDSKANPADMIKKTDAKAAVKKIKDTAGKLESTLLSRDIDGKTELDAAIKDAETAVA